MGRLRKIKNQSSVLVSEYTYNGLGYRIGWHYDVDADSDVDANDVWFHFAYDDAWRIVATFRSSDTNAKELFVSHMAGMNGRGSSSALDAVILRDKDANTSWGSATDGTREERAYYCQNWRGDIVSMLKATGSTNCQVYETVRYSSYGVPFGIPPGDIEGDGDCDNDDGDAILDLQLNGPYTLRADLDLDGSVDTDDVSICTANNGRTLGRGVLSHSTVANRRGYCAYEHDGVIDTLAHARHRVLLTELGRWNRRDPLGYVDGHNLFTYLSDNAVASSDPSGTKNRPRGGPDRHQAPSDDQGDGGPCISAYGFPCLLDSCYLQSAPANTECGSKCGQDSESLGVTYCDENDRPVCCICDTNAKRIYPNQQGRELIMRCTETHEQQHLWNSCPFPTDPTINACDECNAYARTLDCLEASIGQCSSYACTESLLFRSMRVRMHMNKECSTCFGGL